MGELTKAVPLKICWEMLKERCNRRYDNKASSSITILNGVVNDLQDCSFLSKPSKDATHAEEIVLSCLNIQPKCYQQRKTIMVKWRKPPANSIKLNSDGDSKGNPGPAGGGCILRDHTGNMVYALSNFYGLCSTIPMKHTQLVYALTEYTNPD